MSPQYTFPSRPGPKLFGRLALVVVLVVYLGLFLRWSFNDQWGPALCCGEAELLVGGVIKGECWRNGLSGSACDSAIEYTRTGLEAIGYSPLMEGIQAAWLLLVGLESRAPLFALFLVYLLSLLSVYLIAERLASPLGGVWALLVALTLDLYSWCPLISGPVDCGVVVWSPIVFAPVLVLTRHRRILMPLLAGAAMAVTLLARWYTLWLLPFSFLAVVLWYRRGARWGAKGTLPGLLRHVGLYLLPLVPLLVARGPAYWSLAKSHLQRGEVQQSVGGAFGVWRLLSRARLSFDWSALWPPSLLGYRVDPSWLLGALAGLALLSVPLALLPRRRSWRLLPVSLALVALVPLLLTFVGGDHPEGVLVWLVVASSIPLGWLLVRLPGTWSGHWLTGLLMLLVLFGLGRQWTQDGGSLTFGRMVGRADLGGSELDPSPVSCRGGRCAAFISALKAFQREVLADRRRLSHHWRGTGFCFHGLPPGPPYSLVTARGTCGRWRYNRSNPHPIWRAHQLQLLYSRKGRSLRGPGRVGYRRLDQSACALVRSLNAEPGRRCRWLLALERDLFGRSLPGLPQDRRLRGLVARWRKGLSAGRVEVVLRRRLRQDRLVLWGMRLVGR